MKRVSIIALALALLLCGCGSAPAQPVSAAAPPTHKADAAVSPEIIEDEPEAYDSARDFLRSLYDECGNFYFSNNAAPDCLDWLAQQPQDQPVKFVVYGWPFSNSDKRLDKWNIPLQNHDRALMRSPNTKASTRSERRLMMNSSSKSCPRSTPNGYKRLMAGRKPLTHTSRNTCRCPRRLTLNMPFVTPRPLPHRACRPR